MLQSYTVHIKMSTSADWTQDVHDHQTPAQPNQLPDVEELMHQDGPSLLDVDHVYLEYENGGGLSSMLMRLAQMQRRRWLRVWK